MPYYHGYFERPVTKLGTRLLKVIYRKLFAVIRRFLAYGSRVLDVGSGRGELADLCVQSRVRYTGIEPNDVMRSALEQRGFQIRKEPAPPLLFPDESFDLVIAAYVIEHLSGPLEAFHLLEESFRVLAPGGTIAVAVPDFMRLGREFWNIDYTHTFPTTRRGAERMLEDAGFKLEAIREHSGPLFGPARYIINGLLRIYPYGLLQVLLGRVVPRRYFYKFRVSFVQCIILIGRKPGQKSEKR